MYVVVPTCCFCENVRDDVGAQGEGPWLSVKEYRSKYGWLPSEMWRVHTECPACSGRYDVLVSRGPYHGASLHAGR